MLDAAAVAARSQPRAAWRRRHQRGSPASAVTLSICLRSARVCFAAAAAQERDQMGDDRPDDFLGAVYPEQAGINLTWP